MNIYTRCETFSNSMDKLNGLTDIVHIDMHKLENLEMEFVNIKKNVSLIIDCEFVDDLINLLKQDVYSDLEVIKKTCFDYNRIVVPKSYTYIPINQYTDFPHYFMALFIF